MSRIKATNGNNHARGSRGVNGVRLDPNHDVRARAKIQCSQVLNRLIDFVNGPPDKEVTKTKKVGKKLVTTTRIVPIMSQGQVAAAVALLRKIVPDLTNTTFTGQLDIHVNHHEAAKEAIRVIEGRVARINESERAAENIRLVN